MSRKRANRPLDQSNENSREDLNKSTKEQRITNSSRELNRNEEQTSPSGRPQQDQHSRKPLDRSSEDLAARENNSQQFNQGSEQDSKQRNKTTGSNVPGSEIADMGKSEDHMKKTSRDEYTGNSERSGSQYSVTGKSERKDQELTSGHPSRDDQRSQEIDENKRSKSANQGMKQQGSDAYREGQLPDDDDQIW